ncbi:MAG: SPOR domain-containing protein [Crocinitomicaceae bacterium]|nr:HU-CCDC81 and SPOR domain-containing protein [Crocinitomicaceae bacterium]
MKLNKHISALLHEHNCVIVPDFGGFVANYRSAVIDDLRKKIHPPSKSVLFNVNLKDNDGLLGNYVARKEQTDYTAALDLIALEVKNWKQELSAGQRIEIGEVGFLYEENGKVHFEQSREVNLLMQAYGLRSIDFVNFKQEEKVQHVQQREVIQTTSKVEDKPLELVVDKTISKENKGVEEKHNISAKKETPVIKLDPTHAINEVKDQEENEEVIPIRKPNRVKTIMKYTAAVLFVPVLFYSYWIPMETDFLETRMIHFSDFNPVHKQSEKKYQSREKEVHFPEIAETNTWEQLTENIDASVYNYEVSEDFYVPINLENESGSGLSTNDEQQVSLSGNYHIIVGCFSVKDNASNLVNDLQQQGYSAAILDKNKGLHRVTAGGYDTRDAANSALDNLKGSGQSGWILKK